MENEDFKEFAGLIKIFSKFIINNKIPTEKYTESFTNAFNNLVKTQQIGELSELVKLNHYINNHQDSDIKLQCGKSHCIECYTQIVQPENYIQNVTICSCRQKIAANFKKKILDNYERIQKLKMLCCVCGKTKDNMEFIKTSHKCFVCNSCTVSTFNYNDENNNCPNCGEQYDKKCDLSIREVLDTLLDEEIVKKYYEANCPQCGNPNNRRTFVETCRENACLACTKCVNAKKEAKDKSCWCGDEISIIF